jgi:Family of unknown function (DUF6049)/Glycosyl hydrolase family 57
MRRPLALGLACLLSVAFVVVPGASADAQEPSVRFTLLEQSPQWNDANDSTIRFRVRAENLTGDPIDDLRLGVTMWSPVYSRTAYEQSLSANPPNTTIFGETVERSGVLEPGSARDFDLTIALPLDQISSTQSFVYPLEIDLRSGYRSLAQIRTPIIFIVREPLFPLAFSWTFVLDSPLVLGPDGRFTSDGLETSISPGGRLAAEVSALTHVAGARAGVDLVVSPLLLLQLLEMRDGYAVEDATGVRNVAAGQGGSAAANDLLERLRTIAHRSNVEVSALPYSDPLLPALTSGGLARDLGVQLERGRELVSEALGVEPSTSVFRPPHSAIDEASLDELPAAGISTLLLDPSTVHRTAAGEGFAPSPIVSLAAQNATLTGVVSDAAVQSMLDATVSKNDPVLASQAILGELAQIWLEYPGRQRGLAISLGEDVQAPSGFYLPFVRAITGAPWLSRKRASRLVEDADVPRPDAVAQVAPSPSSFSASYVGALKQARRRVEVLRSMLVQPSEQPDRLDELLLLAEGGSFVGDETAGRAFVGAVESAVESTFGAVRPEVPQPITLTSNSIRNVPIAVRNTAAVPLRVTIRLVSDHLLAPVERTDVFPPDTTETIDVDLALRTTGRFQVRAQIVAPSGRVIGETPITVRSTAYNRVALVITIGGALLALLVWARRFVPRRTG